MKDKKELTDIRNQFRGIVYPYTGSGMLTNTVDETVIENNVRICMELCEQYASEKLQKLNKLFVDFMNLRDGIRESVDNQLQESENEQKKQDIEFLKFITYITDNYKQVATNGWRKHEDVDNLMSRIYTKHELLTKYNEQK